MSDLFRHISPRQSLDALRIILTVWRPYAGRLVSGLVLSVLALCAGLALMWNAGAGVSALALGIGLSFGALRLAGTGRIVLRYAERLFTHDAMFRALAALRVWFFRRLAGGAAAGLGFRRAGDLLNRLVGDVDLLDNLYLRIAVPLICAAVSLPVIMIVAFRSDWRLGCALTVIFAVAAFILPLWAALRAARTSQTLLHSEAALRIAALDLATGLREARAFAGEDQLAQKIYREEGRLHEAQRVQGRAMSEAGALSYLLGQSAIGLVLIALCGLGGMNVAFLPGVALVFLTGAVFETIGGLARIAVLTGQVARAAERVVDVAGPDATEGKRFNGDLCVASEGGDLVFEDVVFRWSSSAPVVINHISLTIRAGEHIALIGPSGAGKSSLAALLLKVARPQSGRITLGSHELDHLDTQTLRGQIGWLSQSTHLFADTIRANLLLGRQDVADDALWDALERAEVAEVVQALPDGLDSWIGEGGARLSGGQGRRITLARVLLRDTPILVLDEPATGLDAETEQAFLRTLNRTSKGKTIILIAHRLTGVEQLDRVWRLENGHIVPLAL